jgi:hypothetical protein
VAITPVVTPNPHHMFVNWTHVLFLDLTAIQAPLPLRVLQHVMIRGYHTQLYTECSSWDSLACPNRRACSEGPGQRANLWQCWIDEAFDGYCHGVADKHVPGTSIRMKSPSHFEDGVTINYAGDDWAFLKINATCNHSLGSIATIALANAVVRWDNAGHPAGD